MDLTQLKLNEHANQSTSGDLEKLKTKLLSLQNQNNQKDNYVTY